MAVVLKHKNLKWPKVKLGQKVEFTNGGAWKQEEYTENGIPVVRVTDIQNGTITLENCKYLPFESLKKYKKHTLFEGDLVIATVGSHPTQPGSVVGRPVIVPRIAHGALLNQNAVRLKPLSEDLDKRFLGYLGKSQSFREYILQSARGSANQVRMSIALLKEMEFELPPLETQKKIAAILSAYDDLIENNTRRIAILEAMAQALYREWFVHFRYPGHGEVPLVDSPLGPIPQGWEVKPIGTRYRVMSGFAFKSKDLHEYGEAGVIKIKNIQSNFISFSDSEFIKEPLASKSHKFKLKAGDVLIAMTGAQVGKAGMVPYSKTEWFLNQRVGKFVPQEKSLNNSFIYEIVKTTEFRTKVENTALGAAQPNISSSGIESIEWLLPTLEIEIKFQECLDPIFCSLLSLNKRTRLLCQTRDLLLPRLISGQLDVSELEVV